VVSNRKTTVLLNVAGLHGAKVVITGRRQQVLTDSCAALAGEGIAALGVQVLPMAADWRLYCTCLVVFLPTFTQLSPA